MGASNLATVEKKVLGAMLILADDEMVVQGKMKDIARVIGYKAVGGILTYAIRALEMKNFIEVDEGKYKVLL